MNILHIVNPGISGINGVTNAVMELANSQVKFDCNVAIGLIAKNSCIKGDNMVEIPTIKKVMSLLNIFNPDIFIYCYLEKKLIFFNQLIFLSSTNKSIIRKINAIQANIGNCSAEDLYFTVLSSVFDNFSS